MSENASVHAFRPMVDILHVRCELGGRAYGIWYNFVKVGVN